MFFKYTPYTHELRDSAVAYFLVPFTPIMYSIAELQDLDSDIQFFCSPAQLPSVSYECMYDYQVISDGAAQTTLSSRITFNMLNEKLGAWFHLL